MPRAVSLDHLARDFRGEVAALLNATVCDGLTLPVIAVPTASKGTKVMIGHGLSKTEFVAETAFPLRRAPDGSSFYLNVWFRLELDREQEFLAVASSSFGLYEQMDISVVGALFRYEYERGKPDSYPEAHLHVRADWTIAGNPAQSLHLPLGDRRFRLCLEDLIQFLIVEGATTPRTDQWPAILDAGRARWRELQLRAAVRRYPAIARDALDKLS